MLHRIQSAVSSVCWPSGSLVLRHRKKCLIPAHRETPNSQQEETQSQMKMILSHRVSVQESEGENETFIEQNVLCSFSCLWLCAWLTGLHQEKSNDCDDSKRTFSPTPTHTRLDTNSRETRETSLLPPCPEDTLPACVGKQKGKNTG